MHFFSEDELQALYNEKFHDKLQALEEDRKALLYYRLRGLAIILVIISPLFIPHPLANTLFSYLFIVGLVVLGFQYMGYKKALNAYRVNYKQQIVGGLVQAMDPAWGYYPDEYLWQKEYNDSLLFQQKVHRYKGEDLITGQIEHTSFRCSELHTEYRRKSGKNNVTWETIFRGLLFHADFNKHFQGVTIVKPETLLSSVLSFSFFRDDYTVKLENPDFEKYFEVRANDQQEARYILTPAIMEAIVKLRQYLDRDIHLSFVNNRVYCAIEFFDDLFEPNYYRTYDSYRHLKSLYLVLRLNALIIKELNLNTRIWTKV